MTHIWETELHIDGYMRQLVQISKANQGCVRSLCHMVPNRYAKIRHMTVASRAKVQIGSESTDGLRHFMRGDSYWCN